MRVSEWVAVAYFAYLFASARLKRAWPRRGAAASASLAMAVAIFSVGFLPAGGVIDLARDWMPTLYLVLGYWLSGWYFVAPMKGIEARFLGIDWRVLGRDSGASLVRTVPRVILEASELAYVSCFLFVPGGLLLLTLTGHRDAADRFWTLVLLGEFGSFAALPWIQTRPPRSIEAPGAIERRGLWMRELNRLQVSTVSIGVNTFPSGHVAGALATAIGVSEAIPALAPWLLAIVAAIAFAAVVGRYHYFVDAVAGAILTLTAWGLMLVLWH